MTDMEKLMMLAQKARGGDSEAVEYMIGWLQDLVEPDPNPELPVQRGRKPDMQQLFQILDYAVIAGLAQVEDFGRVDRRGLVTDTLFLADLDGIMLSKSKVKRTIKDDIFFILQQIRQKS